MGLGVEPLSIREDTDSAFQIGAEEQRAGLLETMEHRGMRVVKLIGKAGAGNGKSGLGSFQKIGGGRGTAAVMGQLENVYALELGVVKELGFDAGFDVASEEEAVAAMLEQQDQGGEVGFFDGGIARRPQGFDSDLTEAEGITGGEIAQAGALALSGGKQLIPAGAANLGADPEFPRAEVFVHGEEAADMVEVTVRGDEGIEPGNAAAPEVGGDGFLAGVGTRGDAAAAIEDGKMAGRRGEEKGIALANVDGSEFQMAWAQAR